MSARRRSQRFAIAVFLSSLSAAPSMAAPWFGVELPSAQGLDPEQIYARRDFPMLPLNAPEARAESADIHAAELFELVRDQVALSIENRAGGDLVWGRVAGRSGDRAVTAYIRKKLVEAGVADVRTDTVVMPPQTWPVAAELALVAGRAMGEGTHDYRFATLMPQPGSPATPERGIAAEVAYVGEGRDVDLARTKLDGKIAVLRGRPAQGAYNTARDLPDKLAAAGAVAVVVILDLPIDVQTFNRALAGTRVPTVAIADYEGRFLESVIAKAGSTPITARLKIENAQETNPTSNVIGVVRGTSDEYAIVIAHHDSFFYGANDNASGVAAMLGLARHVAGLGTPPRRTHVFVATGGHHAGGFPGSTKVATDYLSVRDKTAIVLNAEHIAAVNAIEYTPMDLATWGSRGGLLVANTEVPKFGSIVPSNPALLDLFQQSLARYGVAMLANAWQSAPGDVMPFQQRGYPVAQIIEVGTWYHTTGDVLAAVSPVGLERATRAFADFLHDIDTQPLGAVAPLSDTSVPPNRNFPLAGVATAGQPSATGLAAIAKQGYATVVDLRAEQEERGFDEMGTVEKLGMKYVSLPIDGAKGVTYANAQALDRILADSTGPVLLHCASANRAGAMLALRARLQGADADAALALGVRGGVTGLKPVVERLLREPPPSKDGNR